MKRFLPRALPAWVLIVLIAALLVTQTTLFVIMSRDRAASSEIVDLYRVNERAFWLAKLMAPLNVDERKRISSELADSTVVVNPSSTPAVGASSATTETLEELEDILHDRLARFDVVDARIRLDAPQSTSSLPASDRQVDTEGGVEEDLSALATDFLKTQRFTVSLQFKDGQWLNFVMPVTPVAPILSLESLPTYLAISLFGIILAFWAIWKLTSPYQVLEEAIAQLGRDLNSSPISERGGKDYRLAARALNETQSRLLAYVQERELLAAALAHDLRTPVTRMRLRLALLKASRLKDELGGDIANIEATVESVVELARSNIVADSSERLDFRSLVETVLDDYSQASVDETVGHGPRLICHAPPVALERCIRNLVENAIKYGEKAHVSICYTVEHITLVLRDEGDGIPPALLNNVFLPFVRLEGSRNRQTGGSGLGLTIARTLVRKVGGDIELKNLATGGLEARMIVPRSM